MSKPKKWGMSKFSLDLPTEDSDAIKALASDVGLRFSSILRFLVRDALVDPEATREKIKDRQEAIKALGGKL